MGAGPRCFWASPASSPLRRCSRHAFRFEKYNPSRRSRAPISPGLWQASASFSTFTLYSAVNRRRVDFATTSTSLDISAGTVTTFDALIPTSLLALYSKLRGGECLTHVDTEGRGLDSV